MSDKSSDCIAQLAERAEKRAETAERKKKVAEEFKDQGNKHFREKNWDAAIECYEKAVLSYGPRVTYMNNLAAAYLKVERYDEAERATNDVLKRDPRMVKARYRRALARKGQGLLKSALCDIAIAVQLDSASEEIQRELQTLHEMIHSEPDYDAEDAEMDEVELGQPLPEDDPDSGMETPTFSDSSDFEHEGNSVPCRYYNHGRCKKGKSCKFRHAPDNRSVRDDLGRNVCLFYMLDICKFPESECNYAHDMSYLSKGPWDEPGWGDIAQLNLELCGGDRSAQVLETVAHYLKPPIRAELWLPRNMEMEEMKAALSYQAGVSNTLYGRHRVPGYGSLGGPSRGSGSAGPLNKKGKKKARGGSGKRAGKAKRKGLGQQPSFGVDEEEMEERMANLGFTNAEVFELACQGVKPWDDDAWDVLHALSDL